MKGCNVEEAARAMADIEDTTLDMLAVLVADSARLDKLERIVDVYGSIYLMYDKRCSDYMASCVGDAKPGPTLREAIDAVKEGEG